jgi:hypothetical protein
MPVGGAGVALGVGAGWRSMRASRTAEEIVIRLKEQLHLCLVARSE